MKACAYRADGTRRRASERVRAGETVILVRPAFEEPNVPLYFDVLHEDDAILAVDKPAGLPVHPSATYLVKKWTVVCGACHDNDAAQAHIQSNTTSFGVESCDVCHGQGREFAVEKVHLPR